MNRSEPLNEPDLSIRQQLVWLRDEKSLFLNTHFPDPGSKRFNMDRLLAVYTDALERMLATPESDRRTIVLIGSTVTVTYVEDGMSDTFTIVFPHEADPALNRISFFSPIAEQLLLRSADDVLPFETNMGVLHVRVDRIEPPDIR